MPGGSPTLQKNQLLERFKILEENDRVVYFSLVGYEPHTAEIAIVGLNPAFTQLNNFCIYYQQTQDFDESRKLSAFSNPALRGNLVKMLDYLGVGGFLGFNSASQLFSDEGRSKVLMTSVVKCGSLNKDATRRSSDWNVLQYSFAVKCANNRLLYDLRIPQKLKLVFVLGNKASIALKGIIKEGKTLYKSVEMQIAPIIELPHPSSANNENVLIFIEKKTENEVRQKNRYLHCIELRKHAVETIKKVFK